MQKAESDISKLSEILRSFPLETFIYDMITIYVLNCDDSSSQSHKNELSASSNDIRALIKLVLLPAVESQEVVDHLTIRLLEDYVFKTPSFGYSLSKVINLIKNLPYSFDQIISYTLSSLSKQQAKLNSLEDIWNVLRRNDSNNSTQLDTASKLLMVAVALNESAESSAEVQPKTSNSLKTLFKIIDWVLCEASNSAKLKALCLEMALKMTVSLLKIGQPWDQRDFITSEGLMARLIQTVFWFNSAQLKWYTKQIYDQLLWSGTEPK